jgi:hypothetical protein
VQPEKKVSRLSFGTLSNIFSRGKTLNPKLETLHHKLEILHPEP